MLLRILLLHRKIHSVDNFRNLAGVNHDQFMIFRRAKAYNVHTAKFSQLLCFPISIMLERIQCILWYAYSFCVLHWVTRKTINQSRNDIRTRLHSNNSKGRYSAITKRISDRRALRIMNYSVLPLLFRLCANCTTSVLKGFSIIFKAINFPAMSLSMKLLLIVSMYVGLSSCATVCIGNEEP